jgi:hypothetical protein
VIATKLGFDIEPSGKRSGGLNSRPEHIKQQRLGRVLSGDSLTSEPQRFLLKSRCTADIQSNASKLVPY